MTFPDNCQERKTVEQNSKYNHWKEHKETDTY